MTEINIQKIQVIDNYLPIHEQQRIHDDLMNMDWQFKNSPYANFDSSRMFGISLYYNDNYHKKCPQSIIKLAEDIHEDILSEYHVKMHRILANMQGLYQYAEVHVDSSRSNFLSVIYHVNESMGDTTFHTGQYDIISHSIPFKMGRIIIFPSHWWHQGLPPTKYMNPTNNFRISLGFCFENLNFIEGSLTPWHF